MATATPEFRAPQTVPTGAVPFVSIPDSWDFPRLVYVAPYFTTVPLAELIDPSVKESIESLLPSLVPPYVQDAANTAVANLAVVKTGSTMTGPLFLSGLPTQPTQAATMSYVDMMVSTSGVPEVPAAPAGQTWGRQTGQWVAIASASGTFLNLSGGTMQGAINMGGNSITNLPAVPQAPYGAANMTWVLDQIAAQSLYQGTWNADNNTPDLTQPGTHQNEFSWIATTVVPAGVVVSQPIPGIQGLTIYNGDNLIYSTFAGKFQVIHAGGLTAPQADARYVMLTGSTMSGALLLNADPTSNMQAATRQWVLAQTVFPESPADGQVYGRQGLSHSWLPALPIAGGVLTGALTLNANAVSALNPVPLQQLTSTLGNYVPLAGNVTVTGPITMAGGSSTLTLATNAAANLQAVPLQQLNAMLVGAGAANVGRNLLHNPLYNVAQRGFGPITVGGYVSDRWVLAMSLDTNSMSTVAISDANRAAIGDEAAVQTLTNTFTGNAGAASFSTLQQRVEGVRRTAGKTFTVSFWAWNAAGALKLGVSMDQFFGTGGSPSASVTGAGQSVTLSTTPTRYSLNFTLASAAGKTLGTNGDDWSCVNFWYSSGTTTATRAGAVGVQSGTVSLWGVQLEIGSVVTPLEKSDPIRDQTNCERFYQVGGFDLYGYQVAGQPMASHTEFRTTMRATPTLSSFGSGQTNITSPSLTAFGPSGSGFDASGLATATGTVRYYGSYTASADL